ncbi:MAG: hypothetical protein DRH32_05965 [Deltaproteobacteria bacterium]|nr:MAG: hypothetical protein DRH32_05965 [Deltaproteobacteria bacterium]
MIILDAANPINHLIRIDRFIDTGENVVAERLFEFGMKAFVGRTKEAYIGIGQCQTANSAIVDIETVNIQNHCHKRRTSQRCHHIDHGMTQMNPAARRANHFSQQGRFFPV